MVRSALLVISLLIFAGATAQAQIDPSRENAPPLIVVDQKNQSVIGTQQIESTDIQELEKILKELPADRQTDVIISTDSPDVLDTVARWSETQNESRKPLILPFGQILKATKSTALARSLGNFGRKTVEAIQRDKIGLMVTVVTTGYDSYLWLHAASVSLEQKTAMVFMNIMLAATFGLDKDLWAKTTRPIEKRFLQAMKPFQLISKNETVGETKKLAAKFFANSVLSFGIQFTRLSILSLDHFVQAVGTSNFWISTVSIATALTVSGFAWSEQIANVDESKYPTAKFILRRWTEIRSLVMSSVAPSAKILQPDVYGITPMIALVVNGAAGLLALQTSEKFVPWLNRLSVFRGIYDSTQVLNHKWKSVLHSQAPTLFPLRCENVFRY